MLVAEILAGQLYHNNKFGIQRISATTFVEVVLFDGKSCPSSQSQPDRCGLPSLEAEAAIHLMNDCSGRSGYI